MHKAIKHATNLCSRSVKSARFCWCAFLYCKGLIKDADLVERCRVAEMQKVIKHARILRSRSQVSVKSARFCWCAFLYCKGLINDADLVRHAKVGRDGRGHPTNLNPM